MQSVISCYSAELVFLLAGSDIISMAWEATGVDQRIAARSLALVGTSVKQQILVWFIIATLLSSVLPNTVVAAVMCSRSEEHTSELQSLQGISYAVFCLKKGDGWCL